MKYIVKSQDFKGDIIFGYDDDGFLSSLTVNAELNEVQWRYFHGYFPVTETYLKLLVESSKKLEMEPVVPDLSFEAFWTAYDYNLGNKDRTRKLWEALPESVRSKIMGTIKKYDYWLACHPNTDKLHASTFLNQRRYEGDFTVKK